MVPIGPDAVGFEARALFVDRFLGEPSGFFADADRGEGFLFLGLEALQDF
jgi:hypothetical protein